MANSKLCGKLQRLKHSDRTIMIPEQVIEMATIDGAKALHMEEKIGSLEVGKKADIIIVEDSICQYYAKL
ncbi:hypothetical protein BTO22_05930 [Aliivibrio sifiae]|uniref:Amidohydrolase-related domain-containing protein n=1 Tax=Aliivibrio sifiae TaxID=566293 RepID=A0A2S7XCS2_9GAMM|nr:hypothetical protein BTO22_05930 [Aliivibrio sifiae]